MRNSFAFYYSWWEAIKNLPRDVQGDVLTAIVEYGLTGVTTEQLKPITKAMLTMVKTQIDIDNKRFENGKKGGRKKPTLNQIQTKIEPNPNQNITKSKPNLNQNQTKLEPNNNQGCGLVSEERENEKDVPDGFPLQPLSLTSEKDKEKEYNNPHSPNGELPLTQGASPAGDMDFFANPFAFSKTESGLKTSEETPPPSSAPPPSPKRNVFVKPTLEQVKAYFSEKGFKSDPEHFYDHFESNGWKVGGRGAMKDWKAAVRNWERNNGKYTKTSYGREKQQRFGATPPDDFAGKGSTRL